MLEFFHGLNNAPSSKRLVAVSAFLMMVEMTMVEQWSKVPMNMGVFGIFAGIVSTSLVMTLGEKKNQ